MNSTDDYFVGAHVYIISLTCRKKRASIERVTKSTIIVDDVKYRRSPTKGRKSYQGFGRYSREGVKPALTSKANDGSRIVLADEEDRRLLLREIKVSMSQLTEDVDHLWFGELGDLSRALKSWAERAHKRKEARSTAL